MTMKKLQVFVSSTYTDLREERQAAVEAILLAGHIPAGMELFAAGDESQLETIKRWIDDSDVYLLLLGGRYGSIESRTGKSYTQLEFEYAVERKKPHFALVITDACLDTKAKAQGLGVVERENHPKLQAFRKIVQEKIVRFWDDTKDIKLAILETLAGFAHRTDLIGWVPGDLAVSGAGIAEELARLTKENAELRSRIANVDSVPLSNGLTFHETCDELEKAEICLDPPRGTFFECITAIQEGFGSSAPNALHVLWIAMDALRESVPAYPFLRKSCAAAMRLGLVTRLSTGALGLTEDGGRFVRRCRIEKRDMDVEKLILPAKDFLEAMDFVQSHTQ